MPQSIQPITDAIRRGDKNKAIELVKQALSIDPNDIDILLVLAAIVDEPTRKRQVLNRVLSLSPTSKAARAMLLEMDGAEMSAYRK
jgi:Flp pilus assembly protein TadD